MRKTGSKNEEADTFKSIMAVSLRIVEPANKESPKLACPRLTCQRCKTRTTSGIIIEVKNFEADEKEEQGLPEFNSTFLCPICSKKYVKTMYEIMRGAIKDAVYETNEL